MIYFIDLTGTLVFAISGVLAASEKKFDIFGASILGIVTAVGGGTLRDVLIGSTPVGWMLNSHYSIVISVGIILGLVFKNKILQLRKTMFLFDTIGIGLFTVLGLQKTLNIGLSPMIAILMGTVSAVFGGVLRDVLSNEVPLIFRKEIYATACLAGGVIFILLSAFSGWTDFNMFVSIMVIIVIRVLAVRYHWALPPIK
ncbi:MAG TPA: trimeric intracellular cation channel family protein [Saprospiraceae bacterium]|nr:trimeric intracellular cation channel family protein [Saprospiraceae bacterium]